MFVVKQYLTKKRNIMTFHVSRIQRGLSGKKKRFLVSRSTKLDRKRYYNKISCFSHSMRPVDILTSSIDQCLTHTRKSRLLPQ